MQKGLTSIITHTVYDDTNTSGVCAKFVEIQLILEYRGAIKALWMHFTFYTKKYRKTAPPTSVYILPYSSDLCM